MQENDDSLVQIKEGQFKGSKPWEDCDFYDITARIITCVADLQTRSHGNFDPMRDEFTIRTPKSDIVSKANKYGRTVSKFINSTWPKAILETGDDSWCSISVGTGDSLRQLLVQVA